MPNAGDFSCADLVMIQVKLDQMWADSAVKQDYTANCVALQSIIQEQTAQFPQLKTEKDTQVKIAWLNHCDDTVSDCTNDCIVGGDELSADCKTYELDICKTTGFSVKEKALRAGIFSKEELIAKAMLQKLKIMDEQLTQTVVSALDTYTGVNQFLNGFTTSGNDTVIPATYWTPDLFAYFYQTMIMNKHTNSFMLSGSNLFQAEWIARMNMSNSEKAPDMAKMNTIRKYFDLFNMDSVLGTKKTFTIDKGAVAFVSKNYYPSTPIQYIGAGQTRYSVPSKNLSGVTYDVIYTNDCTNNEITHHWSFYVKAGFFLNPTGCNSDNTGVLSFTCA
jgi:hypothetical protein